MEPHATEKTGPRPETPTACTSTGCGGAGMCPGQALLLSILAGYGVQYLTGQEWLFFTTAFVGTVLLVSGWYRYLNPFRRRPSPPGNG